MPEELAGTFHCRARLIFQQQSSAETAQAERNKEETL
jgi:hypothetical protein